MSYKKHGPILILGPTTVFWFLLVSAIPAYAYLDPGSGSMLLQLLLGGVAALAVILKFYWNRFLSLFGRDKKNKEETK
jgi:membrane protein implicated in regulation of membrane protease activity